MNKHLFLEVFNKTKLKIDKDCFEKIVTRAETEFLKQKRIKIANHYIIHLTFVSDKAMIALNKVLRGINKATDVLSLSYIHPKMDDNFAGEIFIDPAFAKEQAKIFNHSLQNELKELFIHGILHIFGYDHLAHSQATKMLEIARKINGGQGGI